MKLHNVPGLLQVIVKVNNGIRDFSTSVTPKQSLCDGRWHRVTGEKSCVSWVFFIKRSTHRLWDDDLAELKSIIYMIE